ncbi:MAG: hypothetical protein C0417_08830 [Chlorobiaceae bacterium]|nr:hypothetical protein [Chlorobiaceae bacterium]
MPNIDEIKKTIETLSPDDYGKLRQWFSERDWERWDEQIENDSKSGKLDFLVKEFEDDDKIFSEARLPQNTGRRQSRNPHVRV